jgi:hypothetical protein
VEDPAVAFGISLWLMPEGRVRETLAARIVRLASRLGTIPFPPHVTLLSGLAGAERDIVGHAAAVAREMEPIRVELGDVEGRDAHFRCLYHLAGPLPALRDAHALAARHFGREADPSFEPHLSLVYGTLAPAEKARLAREWAREHARPGAGVARVEFEVRDLHVWRTSGRAEAWSEIGVLALGPSGL